MIELFLGPMGAGKSTLLLQDYHNVISRGFDAKLLTGSESGFIRSRLGIEREALVVRDSLLDNGYASLYDLMIDECQFLSPAVVKQICFGGDAVNLSVPDRNVRAYGLLTDFCGRIFEGTAAWLAFADRVTFLPSVVLCHCGAAASMNARVVDGRVVKEGDVFVEGDFDEDEVFYVPLCRFDWERGRFC
jgi:thymidine kinase